MIKVKKTDITDQSSNDMMSYEDGGKMSFGKEMSNTENYFLQQVSVEISKANFTGTSLDKDKHAIDVLKYFADRMQQHVTPEKSDINNFEFVDLFCGAGGLSAGLEQSNLIPNLALDKDAPSLLSYHFNRPFLNSSQIINDDIRKVVKEFEFKKSPLIVGGPPCQGFSNANKQRKENDDRNELYKFYLHTVDKTDTDIFLLENVEGILKYFDQIQQDFEEINFTLFPYRLNTRDFGFPQNRKRVFILGINNKHLKIHNELHDIFTKEIDAGKNKVSFSLWDAIFDLPQLSAKTVRNSSSLENDEWGYTFGKFRSNNSKYSNYINSAEDIFLPLLNHKSKYNNQRDIEIYSLLKPGEGSDSESIAQINPYLNRGEIFKDKFYKLRPDEPSKTITAHMYYDCHMYIHPYLSRGLTPREAARVQGFADDYLFLGSPNEWYRQIGNAVSPILARILGKALHKVLNRIYEF